MDDEYFVYSISQERTGKIFYIGQTSNFEKRVKAHLRINKRPKIRTTNIKTWLFDEIASGHIPQFKILEKVNCVEDALAAETKWIYHFADLKQPLLNRWKHHRQAIKNV